MGLTAVVATMNKNIYQLANRECVQIYIEVIRASYNNNKAMRTHAAGIVSYSSDWSHTCIIL